MTSKFMLMHQGLKNCALTSTERVEKDSPQLSRREMKVAFEKKREWYGNFVKCNCALPPLDVRSDCLLCNEHYVFRRIVGIKAQPRDKIMAWLRKILHLLLQWASINCTLITSTEYANNDIWFVQPVGRWSRSLPCPVSLESARDIGWRHEWTCVSERSLSSGKLWRRKKEGAARLAGAESREGGRILALKREPS